jgi:hypothetical protein
MIDNTVGKYQEKVMRFQRKMIFFLNQYSNRMPASKSWEEKPLGRKTQMKRTITRLRKICKLSSKRTGRSRKDWQHWQKLPRKTKNPLIQERLMALGQYVRIKQNLIAAEGDLELRTKKLSAKEKIAIERNVDDEQIRIAQDSGEILSKIQDDYLKNLKKNNKDLVSEYGTTYEKLHSLMQDYLKKRQEAEAKANKKSDEDRKKEMQARKRNWQRS